MYSIQYVNADQWQVMDENDQVAFAGSKRQVEDWLDHQENLRRQSSPRMSAERLARSLGQLVHRLAIRLFRHSEPRDGHTAMRSLAGKR